MSFLVSQRVLHGETRALHCACSVNDGTVMTATVLINPFERKRVATLVVVNPSAAASLSAKYSWKEGPPDAATLVSLATQDENTIRTELSAATRLGFGADSLTVSAIESLCKVRLLVACWRVSKTYALKYLLCTG